MPNTSPCPSQTKQMALEFQLKGLEKSGKFAGYASIFDITDTQDDVMMRGAFRQSLEKGAKSIKLLWQHRPDEPIGYFTTLREDAVGLYVEGQLLLDLQRGREAYSLLLSGAVKGLSIGYQVLEAEYDEEGIRYISNLDLWEISLVTFPANVHSNVTQVKGMSDEFVLCLAIDRALEVLGGG